MTNDPAPVVVPARYAKKMVAVQCRSVDGWKTRAARLAEYLNGRYSSLRNAYIMTPGRVKVLMDLFSSGRDVDPATGELYEVPTVERVITYLPEQPSNQRVGQNYKTSSGSVRVVDSYPADIVYRRFVDSGKAVAGRRFHVTALDLRFKTLTGAVRALNESRNQKD